MPEHTEWLVADLPSMAVRAMEKIASPSLAHAGDVGELIGGAGGDQNAACGQRSTAGDRDGEARFDVEHSIVDQIDAVTNDLGPPCGEEF